MRKFLLFCVLAFMPVVGNAGFHYGTNKVCMIDDDGGTDYFWYCGDQSSGCHGTRQASGDHWVKQIAADDESSPPALVLGDPQYYSDWKYKAFYWEGEKHACCGAGDRKPGTYKKFTSWLTESTKTLSSGGTCTNYTNPCGTVFHKEADGSLASGECTTPDPCPEGKYPRLIPVSYTDGSVGSGTIRCEEPCPYGQGFESNTSTTCIDCTKTVHGGVDNWGNCVRCESDEFFFQDTVVDGKKCAGRSCCKKKTTVPSVSKDAMKRCFRCPIKEPMGKCIRGEELSPEESKQCGLATNS